MSDGMSGGYRVYTDGACSSNPGPGGWGVVIRAADGSERELVGGEADTTNNRMELTAAIMALEEISEESRITLWTDSKYVLDGITSWITAWKRNGWRTASHQPVKNRDLWCRLDAAVARHEVDWRWIRGHVGHPENERADALARQGVQRARRG